MATPGLRPLQRLAVVEDLALRGRDQSGEDAQDRRFAAARGTEQGHDFVGPDTDADVFEHAQRLPVGQGEIVRNVACFAQRGRWFDDDS